MDMSIEQPAAPGGKIRAISTYLYRKPTLYLLLLLVPPLLWFGAVYLGSLLTLLWQGFYTFDDFTMTVTPASDLRQPERAVQPGNYDIIVRTLTMAVVVSLASAVLAFPIAYYMAR
ncbi:Inner membrane ABC transporter permease protein ydcU [Serratia fonticola]|uniref:Inner membrane ABC transporter permease protein ydcU n=1 Tax=Serratia fonticola TaxID=47917 RepID=A0A4V6Z374_SERFO|nr:Inner membrane ABC transporter permease protein ydcU [Serratia fonticola]